MTTCILTGRLVELTGSPIQGAPIALRPDRGRNTTLFTNGNALGEDEHIELTGEDGEFAISLTRGLRLIIRIDALDLHKQVTVPEQATCTLEELIDGNL